MVIFVKLGGSLITDKRVEASFRQDVVERIAAEIAEALNADAQLRLLIGHGSGSFGHFAASRYRTIEGVRTTEEWRAFAHVATVAAELNFWVAAALARAGVPVWRIQPSASAVSQDGRLVEMAVDPLRRALQEGLVPLVYGDVSLDNVRGGTIVSTESVFFYLAHHLPVSSILLLGEVEGVYDANGQTVPLITPQNLPAVEQALGRSAGTDVTGGMESKVQDMLALAQRVEGLQIRIMSGLRSGLLRDTLLGLQQPGTQITAQTE